MATVRFSQELKDEILKMARRKMEPAIDRALQSRPDNSWGMRLYDTMFAQERLYLDKIPAHWFKQVSEFFVSRIVDVADVGLKFELPVPVLWPHTIEDNEFIAKPDGYSYHEAVSLKDHEVWSEFTTEVKAYRARLRSAKERQKEFTDMVGRVLETYTTLAPALKAWPALWELIPEKYKDRHRTVVVKTKKEIELDVDLNKLTALSTAAKLGA